METEDFSKFHLFRKRISLFLGPITFLIILIIPLNLPYLQQRMLAIIVLAFVWWIGEAVPLSITALMIPVLGVLLGIEKAGKAFAPFSNGIIFLFIGSFIIARAVTIHGLDRRFAYFLLTRKMLRGRTLVSIFIFGFSAWALSMWISNSATTAMLMPLCYGLLREIKGQKNDFIIGGMLLIAYSTSAGGIATPVGTPPNLVCIGMLRELAGINISFAKWIVLTIPLSIIFFFQIFIILYLFYIKSLKSETAVVIKKDMHKEFTKGEMNTLIAFSITIVLWVMPGVISPFLKDSSFKTFLASALDESVVALIGAGLLFLLPVNLKEGKPTITWDEAVEIDWGTILLFGGGLCMGNLAISSGLADTIGNKILNATGGSELLFTLFVVALSVFITDIMSNTACANLMIPIIIAAAKNGGFDPFLSAYGVCLGSSMAFLLPISTPPNSIVYGTGKIPLLKMMKVGFILDLLSIFTINIWLWVIRTARI